jgi:hypothetical protein
MKKTLLLTFIGLILFSFSYGQAIIKGKVTDKKTGETLIGVTISLKSKPGVGVTTDLDGNFTLTLPDATVQTLVISYISYESKEEIVHPVMGETIIKNFMLQSVSQDLGEINIVGRIKKSNDYHMENIKKNSASSIDFISSEVMKKTGDVNVTAAVTRVSGVSMSSNGFISVRGISDRYVKTTINGSRIPTLDPFTNNIKLDLFPASLIDNVILTKTASPDLPGDWAGAYISLETKDYPDKLAINMETSVGYNQQTTFKEVLSSQESKTDWLGYDNGLREYDHNSFVGVYPKQTANLNSKNIGLFTLYHQLVGLGLLDYLNSMGVTEAIMVANGDNQDKNPYFILGLVQLGLLDKELQTNEPAIKAAVTKYNTDGYAEKAFQAYVKDGVKSGQAFKNNWLPTKKRAPLNFSQSFSIGNQTKLFGRTLGIMAGFRYGSGIQYDPLSLNQKVTSLEPDATGKIDIEKDSLIRATSKETHTWSALMNLHYKLNINNSVTLLFMPNFNGVNNVSSQDNFIDPTAARIEQSIFYEQRKQLVYQYKSEHLIPGPRIKLELNASYTNGKSSAPDYKQVSLAVGPAATSDATVRRFRYLTDNVFDSRISAEIPLKNSTDERLKKLKFGAAYQNNYRQSDQIEYLVSALESGIPFTGNMEEFFSPDHFGIQTLPDGTLKIPMYYVSYSYPQNHAFGKSSVIAGFGMLDYSLLPFLRIAGGLRVEQANIYTDIVKFHAMGLEPDDPRRTLVGVGSGGIANPGKLNELSFLPSANLIFKLTKDENAPINLRFNYSHTVVRPSIRELSDFTLDDFEYRTRITGNSDLKMAKIKNYDVRFESYFKSRENVSVSGFYKDFKDHIEMVNYTGITWQNVDKSYVLGLELEGKKTIIKKHLDFRANLTFVKSQTTFVKNRLEVDINGNTILIPDETVKRTMVGQAPYVLNGMLIYTADSLGLTVTLSYNVQGPKLAVSSVTKYVPDVYELPRHLLDFKITKKLARHWSASLTIRDVLNAAINRAYKFDDWDTKFDSYKYGTNYVLGISYQL